MLYMFWVLAIVRLDKNSVGVRPGAELNIVTAALEPEDGQKHLCGGPHSEQVQLKTRAAHSSPLHDEAFCAGTINSCKPSYQ